MPITNQAIFDNIILLEEKLNKLSDISNNIPIKKY